MEAGTDTRAVATPAEAMEASLAELRAMRHQYQEAEERVAATAAAAEERAAAREARMLQHSREQQQRGFRAGHVSAMAAALLARPGERLNPDDLAREAARYADALADVLRGK
jgi:hypothetical protein